MPYDRLEPPDTTPQRESDGRWRPFLGALSVFLFGVLALVAVFIFVMDPHDHVAGSPDFLRAPINSNQRYSYPALARKPQFDSAVVGTSTSRMLRPDLLAKSFGGRFVNLAMNSATAYEQSRILDLFVRSRPGVRTLVFGIDTVWCDRNRAPALYTPRPFPEWLYDDNRWNDFLHLLNGPTLEQAVRQLQFQLGRREPRYGFDGYRSFVPPDSEHDLVKVRKKLYGPAGKPVARNNPPATLSDAERDDATYVALELIRQRLLGLPKGTRVILWFVPYHNHDIPAPDTKGGRWLRDCKSRVVELARALPNAQVVDMMFASPSTTTDTYYWDTLHVTEGFASGLPALLARTADGEDAPDARRLFP